MSRIALVSVVALLFLSLDAAAAQPGRGLTTAPPTTVSSRYVSTEVGQILRVGNTVYVAGAHRVAPPTGSAVVISASSGKAQSVRARVAGGPVRTAIPDGAGGWYIGGTFTSVGGVPRPGLARLAGDGTLDTSFVPPPLGQVRALVLDGGRLYVGGFRAQPPTADPWLVPVLSALDPTTGAALPVSYAPLAGADHRGLGVVALAADGGRLYAAFNGTNGIAAYDEGSGALRWSRPGTPSDSYGGPTVAGLAGGKLLVGGQISTSTGPVALQELDPATGNVVAEPAVGRVSGIATVANIAYVLADRKGGGSMLWKLDLSSGALTRLAALASSSAITTDGATVYVATWAPVGGDVRVYFLNLRQAKPKLRPLSQVTVGGGANALALQGGRLLVGGSFLGLGGVERAGLAAFDARTGALLPWRPAVQGGGVAALAHSGKTIYLGGQFTRVAGRRRHGLAAVGALGRGKLLPWHPRLSYADVSTVAVADGRVFAGGTLKPSGTKARTAPSTLLAFSARTGKQVAFKPRIDAVTVLTVWQRLLLAGTSSSRGRGANVTAFRSGGGGQALWTRSVTGGNVPIVFALQPDGSKLFVGGRFTQVAGEPRTNLAVLALDRSGALLDLAPQVPDQVMALARTDYGLVFGTLALNSPPWLARQALGAVSADGQVLPWQITFPPSDVMLSDRDSGGAQNESIEHLAVVPGGLVASGLFSWIGTPDHPTLGSLVWLR